MRTVVETSSRERAQDHLLEGRWFPRAGHSAVFAGEEDDDSDDDLPEADKEQKRAAAVLGSRCVDGVYNDAKSGFSYPSDYALGPSEGKPAKSKEAPPPAVAEAQKRARAEKLQKDLVLALMTVEASPRPRRNLPARNPLSARCRFHGISTSRPRRRDPPPRASAAERMTDRRLQVHAAPLEAAPKDAAHGGLAGDGTGVRRRRDGAFGQGRRAGRAEEDRRHLRGLAHVQ